jgi:hypothetical protein
MGQQTILDVVSVRSVNDQPEPQRPTPPPAPNPAADATIVQPPASDATYVSPSAGQPSAPEWPAEAGQAWAPAQQSPAFGAPPASPYSQPNAPYGAQSGAPYGGQPGAPYGGQPDASYGGQPGAPYGGQSGAPYGAQDGTPPPYGAQPGPAYGAPQPGAYPGYPASGAPGYPPPGSGGTSGFAIASLIFGILGGVLFSVIFGIVALFQIRKRGQTGRGLAITGLVLSGCWVLLIAGGITAAIISDAGNSSASSSSSSGGSTADTDSGSVSVTKLKPGNCINGLNGIGSIEDLPVVACTLPHEGEVYAVFELPAGPWPGDTAVQEQSETRCKAELKTYAPKAAETVEVLYLHPLQLSWSRDRGVTCVATDERGTSVGSVRD